MSGLVSYESSSEEDDIPQASPAAPTASKLEANGILDRRPVPTDALIAPSVVNRDAPMVGPSMPTSFETDQEMQEQNEQVATDPFPANLSEQDLVRHLTQASHPMTALPPSPPGSPNLAVEAKFKKFLELKSKGLHFHGDLATKASFRNPALLNTLMVRAGIEGNAQYASSLPTSIWDPEALPSYAYKEELAKSQQSIRDSEWARKRNEAKAGTRTIDFQSAGTTSASSSQHSTPGFRQMQARS